jgi:cytosolic carboxypeptidase protein 2/3
LEYDLILQNDINTKGNTQWFYFRIVNPPRNKAVKINIVNFRKTDSLFNYGMMPCIYSLEEFKRNKKEWFRGGKNIKYFKNDHQIESSRRYYYTLTFTISTPFENDILLIANSFPYTVSDLNLYLEGLLKVKYKKDLLERNTLVNTVGNHKLEVLTIKEHNPKLRNRPLIFVIARQHPG